MLADVLQTSAAATIAAICENNPHNQMALVEQEVARYEQGLRQDYELKGQVWVMENFYITLQII